MFRLVAVLLLMAAPLGANAQTTVMPSQERIAAAERLLDAMHYDALQQRLIATLVAEAEKNIPERMQAGMDAPLPDELKARLAKTVSEAMRRNLAANRSETRRAAVLIYAHHFTAAELARLAELQKEPVLVKMQAEMPSIMAKTMAVSNAQMQRDMPQLIEELKAVIAEYKRGGT